MLLHFFYTGYGTWLVTVPVKSYPGDPFENAARTLKPDTFISLEAP